MRLQRIRLRNFRGLDDSGEVEFASGVTVVEGPNETGKSSIPEGLDLLLELRDRSKSGRITSVQPVGSGEGPEVEVEMTTGPYRLVYRKRWLSKPETALQVVAPQQESLSGDEAHDRVRAILDETLDSALWEALRLQQGEKLSLPRPGTRDDDKRTLSDVPSLVEALDVAASGAAAAEEDDALWVRVCNEYQRYWTANGRPRKDRVVSADKLRDARGTVAEIKRQLDQIAEEAAELDRLETDLLRIGSEAARCQRQERELSDASDEAEQARAEVERLRDRSQIAAQQRDRLGAEHSHRVDRDKELQSRASEVAELEHQVEQAEPARAAASRRLEQAESALDAARAAVRLAEDEHHRAVEDRDHHRNRIEADQLSERLKRVSAARIELQEAQAVLDAATVDDDLLDRIEQAHNDVIAAEAAAASASASVRTTASRVLAVEIDGDPVELAAGESHHADVNEAVVLVLPDTLEIEVRAGADAVSLAAQRRDAQQALRLHCEQAGVAGLAEARKASERSKEAERRCREAQATIERDLRDLTAEDLQSKVKGLTQRIAGFMSARPDSPPLPADFEAAKQVVADAESDLAQKRTKLDDCEEDRAAAALHEARLGDSNLVGRLESARDNLQQAEADLEAVRSQRADSEIEAELAQAEAEAAAARDSLANAEGKLGDVDSETLKIRLDDARAALRSKNREYESTSTELARLRGSQAALGDQGFDTRRGNAEAELQHVEREHQRMEKKAKAAGLLHEAFSKRRQEARTRYSLPFKDHIEQLGRVVFGQSFAVEIDERLQIVSRTLDGVTLDVGQLSTGALEQLAVICRLACAAIVSPDGGGAPVVLDDALGWSDPDRLQQMCQAIDSAGRQCQVIILTCTPDRYAAVAGARTVKLPS